MLARFFAIQASVPSAELQDQLNRTADTIIKRLENEISHLEYLLEEAETKSAQLEKQLVAAENILKSLSFADQNHNFDIPRPIEDRTVLPNDDNSQPRETNNAEKRSLVVAMADQGYTIAEIAKSTGIGKGEIMLLLHLHKR